MTGNRSINLHSLVALTVIVLAVAACGAAKQAANRSVPPPRATIGVADNSTSEESSSTRRVGRYICSGRTGRREAPASGRARPRGRHCA
jgi:hypothetical protein